MCKQINSNSFKNEITNEQCTFKSYIYIYIYLNVCKQMTDVNLLLLHRHAWSHLTVGKQMINSK